MAGLLRPRERRPLASVPYTPRCSGFMQAPIKLGKDILQQLCCPICRSALELTSHFKCLNPECQVLFPVINGIPILINEYSSLFQIENFTQNSTISHGFFNKEIKRLVRKFIPSISENIKAKENYSKFSELLTKKIPNPNVLVIGGSEIGQGMRNILSSPSIQFIETDISFGPRTLMICDAHDIPFNDNTFDGVIIQAVLEYVIDPYRCADEIYRVLKTNGLVYAETPFIQQVHGGKYDFTRFTYLGHRRLFRRFEEICSGAVCGPGMALAWSYQHFLLSFVNSKIARIAIYAFASFTSWWLKYFDYYLIDKPAAMDAASGYYFLGRKVDRILSDKELIKLYRGYSPP
jgi:uncharacterized protein YbaR (Trm112 family)/SAM-dependent methyltransferase